MLFSRNQEPFFITPPWQIEKSSTNSELRVCECLVQHSDVHKCVIPFGLWNTVLLRTPVKQITFYILSVSQAISSSSACLQTYVVQMPPFISPFSVCQSVVHWLLAVSPVSAWLKHTWDRPQATVINILLNVREPTSDSQWVKGVCLYLYLWQIGFTKICSHCLKGFYKDH